MASQPRGPEPDPHGDAVRAGPQGAVRGGDQHVADVPRPGAAGRGGHPRPGGRGRPLVVHLRGRATIPEFHERAMVGIQSAAGYEEGRPQPTSW